jgi:hypothetical protein
LTLWGRDEISLRWLSAAWGLLSVALTLSLGRLWFGDGAGLAAGGAMALNLFALYYSQEARMYAQLSALALASVWFLSHALRRLRPMDWLLLAAVNSVGLYTHYLYPLWMLLQGLFFLGAWLEKRYTGLSGAYVAVNLLTLALFAPWLPIAYRQLTTWGAQPADLPLTARLESLWPLLSGGVEGDSSQVLSLALFAGIFCGYLWAGPPARAKGLWLLAGVALLSASLLFSDAYRPANLKFLLPATFALSLALGGGLQGWLQQGRFRFVVAGALATLWLGSFAVQTPRLHYDPALRRDDYRAMAQWIAQTGQEAVILNGASQWDVYTYYARTPNVYPLPRGLGGDDVATRDETLALVARYRRLAVLFWGEGERDPNAIVKRTLDAHAYEVHSQWFGDVRLVFYRVLDPPPLVPTVPLAVSFGRQLRLEGYALSADALPLGDVLGVTLFWGAEAPITTRYKIFVQLLDPQGRLVAQHDSEPANGDAPTPTWGSGVQIRDNHGVALPTDLPMGTYQLIVGVYLLGEPQTRLFTAEGQDFLQLKTFQQP